MPGSPARPSCQPSRGSARKLPLPALDRARSDRSSTAASRPGPSSTRPAAGNCRIDRSWIRRPLASESSIGLLDGVAVALDHDLADGVGQAELALLHLREVEVA